MCTRSPRCARERGGGVEVVPAGSWTSHRATSRHMTRLHESRQDERRGNGGRRNCLLSLKPLIGLTEWMGANGSHHFQANSFSPNQTSCRGCCNHNEPGPVGRRGPDWVINTGRRQGFGSREWDQLKLSLAELNLVKKSLCVRVIDRTVINRKAAAAADERFR